jgi:hypothetical protein
MVTPEPADTVTEKEILRETGILITKTYKMYDFKDLGYNLYIPMIHSGSPSNQKNLFWDMFLILNRPGICRVCS